MTFYDFTTTAHGKWILTGEHAVVRGGAAIVFPITSKNMILHYNNSNTPARARFEGHGGPNIEALFWDTLQHGLKLVNAPHFPLSGDFIFYNTIPIGAGMGASAALCTNIARWLQWQQLLASDELFNLARELENLFHGKSSGLDIAASMNDYGIYFNQTLHPLRQSWHPEWYLSYCGKKGMTANCIAKVTTLWDREPLLAQQLDDDMQYSVALAMNALQDSSLQGLSKLSRAIQLAQHCFEQWGLADGIVDQHIKQLLGAGALAAKPTGSGDGGYILSLWEDQPSHLLHDMFKV